MSEMEWGRKRCSESRLYRTLGLPARKRRAEGQGSSVECREEQRERRHDNEAEKREEREEEREEEQREEEREEKREEQRQKRKQGEEEEWEEMTLQPRVRLVVREPRPLHCLKDVRVSFLPLRLKCRSFSMCLRAEQGRLVCILFLYCIFVPCFRLARFLF